MLKRVTVSQEGFALIAAIMACLILLALGLLVIALSTQDIRVSAKMVGDKRSMAAAEEGIHNLSQTFNPSTAFSASPVTVNRSDGVSKYTINYPASRPTSGPVIVPLTGYAVAGGQQWGQSRYIVSVTGQNTEYGTQVTISAGIGYGPVAISTMY